GPPDPNPAVANWMRAHDHDLLGHGWRWIEPWRLSREEERDQLLRAIDTFERVLGDRPLGWNCRSWPSPHTRELLVEEGGFLYDSGGSGDGVPCYLRPSSRPFLGGPHSKPSTDRRDLVPPVFPRPGDLRHRLPVGLSER